MADAPDITQRHARILERMAELGLGLVEAAHARAMAAETGEELAALTLAFHRISRSVRQTLALELRVEAARRDAERQAARAEAERAVARQRQHKDRVRAGLERLVWAETEDEDEADDLMEAVEDRLGDAAITEGFEDTPVETLIARIQADLGLTGAPRDARPDEGLECGLDEGPDEDLDEDLDWGPDEPPAAPGDDGAADRPATNSS